MSRGGKRKGAGRKPGWNHKETHLIRVPKALSELILQYAHDLDAEAAGPPPKTSASLLGKQMSLLKDESEFVTESKIHPQHSQNRICNEIKIESATESKIRPLTLTELSKRLARDKSTLIGVRKLGANHLAAWSKERDPDGMEWEYRSEEKMFYPASI